MEDQKNRKRVETGGILFALFIIMLGGFSLFYDVSPLTALLNLFDLWPLFLIGLGIWIILKNVNQERISVVILSVILIVAVYSAFPKEQPLYEYADSREIPSGVTEMDVVLNLMFGDYTVGATSQALYQIEGFQSPANVGVQTVGSTAHINLSLEKSFQIAERSHNEYMILLNNRLPMTLTGEMALSTCTLDLSDLNLERFVLDSGLGTFKITFGETNTDAVLDMGLCTGTIYIPKSVGVKLVYSKGVASLSVPSDWVKSGNEYTSPNYNTATYRINISMDLGIGTITFSYI
ncbi:MAG: hypothetical protein HXS47_04740 [Theionarchaea archaeon]|nr:hypothetical protein [Theionarchaea archaeon]